MPKKIDKKKQTSVKKKATSKSKTKPHVPLATAKPKAMPKLKAMPKPKAKPIIARPLPKTPCCVDVIKTGQAYTIPYGFRDLKGIQREEQPAVTTDKGRTLNEKPKPLTFSIGTDTEKPVMVSVGTDAGMTGTIIRVPKKKTTGEIETQTEPEEATASLLKQPEPSASSARMPLLFPKRNSRKELENRFEALTNTRYSGRKLSYQEFRDMVEDLERTPKKL